MLTPKLPAAMSMPCIRARFPTDTIHSGGSSDPDMKALAVIPRISPRTSVVMTVMPVAKLLMALRNSVGSIASPCAMTCAPDSVCGRCLECYGSPHSNAAMMPPRSSLLAALAASPGMHLASRRGYAQAPPHYAPQLHEDVGLRWREPYRKPCLRPRGARPNQAYQARL